MSYSFKLKIALTSFMISGALLTAFGILFFAFAFQTGIERMDRELRTLADSSMHAPRHPEHWKDFDKSLQFIYGEFDVTRIALRVVDAKGQLLFQSENAPDTLSNLACPRPSSPPSAGDGSDLMDRLDQNHDNRLSADEFDGPPHLFYYADSDHDGFISQDEISNPEFIPTRPPEHLLPPDEIASHFKTLETATVNWRVGQFSVPEQSVSIAMDMNAFYADINRLRIAFFFAVPTGLVILGFAGWFLAARAMRPVALIADTTEGITAKGLDRRIPNVGTDSELKRLVSVSNGMLDRLEKSYHQAVRFSADAAHELQTPLTILQGELDNAIQTAENGSAEQQRYSMLLEELSNLKAVVQKLLLLAHADEGRLKLHLQPTDLSELIHSATEDIEIMAPNLRIETRIPAGIHLSADAALLNQTLRNMTSNAAKYTTGNGRVLFELEQNDKEVRFTLANTAAAIPAPDRPRLFDRFHRVDKARTAAGSGLGLSLAREIARAHGGELTLNDEHEGMVSFTLTLPMPPQKNNESNCRDLDRRSIE